MKRRLHFGTGFARRVARFAGPRMTGTGSTSSSVDCRLLEVTELLTLGLKRAQLRKSAADAGKSPTGLRPRTERVLRPEGGL
jgi:hypothetical protein